MVCFFRLSTAVSVAERSQLTGKRLTNTGDSSIPEWLGWHAARPWEQSVPPGRAGHGDVPSTMTKIENSIAEGKVQADTNGTLDALLGANPTILQ